MYRNTIIKQYINAVTQIVIFFLLSSLLTISASARPISYPKSWTLMQKYNWEKAQLHIHYSPNIKNSLGILSAYYYNEKAKLNAFQWNYLISRNNQKRSQSNLYSKLHLGAIEKKIRNANFRENKFHATYSLSYDWETRRNFFLYNSGLDYEDSTERFSYFQKVRIGVAPYIAPYGKIHTWIMLQIEHTPEEFVSENQFIIASILRFFKGDILCEIGVDSNNKILFNSIIRF
tara:strand:- start:244 stop:939 length:696 start_codon:yes stop_codon:yes gene_type:complete